MSKVDCQICARIGEWKTHESPFLIHEFEHSYFLVGDHQYFRGYCWLVLKDHVRELHELPAKQQTQMFQELMVAGESVAKTFEPWKLNYASYGNVVEHIHWHIFPRYAEDPDRKKVVWTFQDRFMEAKTTPQQAQELSSQIRIWTERLADSMFRS